MARDLPGRRSIRATLCSEGWPWVAAEWERQRRGVSRGCGRQGCEWSRGRSRARLAGRAATGPLASSLGAVCLWRPWLKKSTRSLESFRELPSYPAPATEQKLAGITRVQDTLRRKWVRSSAGTLPLPLAGPCRSIKRNHLTARQLDRQENEGDGTVGHPRGRGMERDERWTTRWTPGYALSPPRQRRLGAACS